MRRRREMRRRRGRRNSKGGRERVVAPAW